MNFRENKQKMQPNAVECRALKSVAEGVPKRTIRNVSELNGLGSSTDDVLYLFEVDASKVKKEKPDDGYEKFEHQNNTVSYPFNASTQNVSSQSTEQSVQDYNRAIIPRNLCFAGVSSTQQYLGNIKKETIPKTDCSYATKSINQMARANSVPLSHSSTDYATRPHSVAPCTGPPDIWISNKESRSQTLNNIKINSPIVSNFRNELLSGPLPYNLPTSIQNRSVCQDMHAARAIPSVIEKSSNPICQQNNDNLVVTDPSGKNKLLKLVGNVTSFKKNTVQHEGNQQQMTTTISTSTNICNSSIDKQVLPQNTNSNVVKKKRGRPPGQKNKNPRKKISKNLNFPQTFPDNFYMWKHFEPNGNANLENYNSYIRHNPQIYNVPNHMHYFPAPKTTRKYTKRTVKPRSKIAKDSKKKSSSDIQIIQDLQQKSGVRNNQRDDNDCQIVDCGVTPISLSENRSVSQVHNTVQEKSKKRNIHGAGLAIPENNKKQKTVISNINNVSETSTSHTPADTIQNNSVSSAETPQSVTQDDIVELNASKATTNDSYELASSDDEEPAFVYKMRDHATRNEMYSSNVLEECLNGNSSELMSSDKPVQMPREPYNNENTSSPLNSNNLSCTLSSRDSPTSSNFQNNTDHQMRHDENIQFPENGMEYQENLNSTVISQNFIDVADGRIWPNSYIWDNFIYLIYTPDNVIYYTFDPKNPTVIHFPNHSNYLLPNSEIIDEPFTSKRKEGNTNCNNSLFTNSVSRYQNCNGSLQSINSDKDIDYYSTIENMSNSLIIDEGTTDTIKKTNFKLFRLEIRGNDKLGFDEIMKTSNSKHFECNNFTISYESISSENAEKILKFCKPTTEYNFGYGQTSQDYVNPIETHESVENHTVCLWHTNLMASDSDHNPQSNNAISQDTSCSIETAYVASEEIIQVPCRRLLGMSDLSFSNIIHFIMRNKKISTLIETEISDYMSDNATNNDTNMSQVQTNMSQVQTNMSQVQTNMSQAQTNISQVQTNISQVQTNMSQIQPIGRNERNTSLPMQESNNSTLIRPEIKLEHNSNHSFQSQPLEETRCSGSTVPMDFSYEHLTQQNTNMYETHLSEDCIQIGYFPNVTQDGNYIPRNNTNYSNLSTDANRINWDLNIPRQSSEKDFSSHYADMTHQLNNYSTDRDTTLSNLYRTESNNECLSFEDAGIIEDSAEKEITQPRRDFLGNSKNKYVLHETINTEPNQHFNYQNMDNTSTKNQLEYHYPIGYGQASLHSATNNQIHSSRYLNNPYTEFSKTKNVIDPSFSPLSGLPNTSVENIQRVNMREAGMMTNSSHNYVPSFCTYNEGTILSLDPSSFVPRQTQAVDSMSCVEPGRIRHLQKFVHDFDAENRRNKRISKQPLMEYTNISTISRRLDPKMNAAFRFNSGGNIIDQNIPEDKSQILSIKDFNCHKYTTQPDRGFIQPPGLNFDAMNTIQTPGPMNLSLSQFPQLPSTSQTHLKPSDNFSGESLAYKNSDRANSQLPNSFTINEPQKYILENYSMCANEDIPLNLHVSTNTTSLTNFEQNARDPNNYNPSYNEFHTTPQSSIAKYSRENELPRDDTNFQQYHFLELSRPSYQNGPGKITDSNTYMENSFSNMVPTEFTEMYQQSDITGMRSYYASVSQYEELPPQSIQHISTEKVECNRTIVTQIEQAVLSKDESQLTGLLSEVERYSDRTHYHRIKAHLVLMQGRFEDTLNILQENEFPSEIHKEMQCLWSQAQKKLIENQNLQKNLRLKQRVPDKSFPSTIFLDPKEVYSDFYKREQYPKQDARVILATKTGQTEKQVNTWFKNKRQRDSKLNGFVCKGKKGGKRPKLSPSKKTKNIQKPSAPSMPIFPVDDPECSISKWTSHG